MEQNSTAILVQQNFDSFEEFAALAVGWNADFRQLDVERFKSSIFQGMIGDLLVSSASLGCFVEQRGETPPDMRTFAILDSSSSGMRWFGHTIESDALLLFPAHREIDVFSRPGLGVQTFSVPENLLNNYLDIYQVPEARKFVEPAERVFLAPRFLFMRLRDLLRANTVLALSKSVGSAVIDEFQDQLITLLVRIITTGQSNTKNHPIYHHNTLNRIIRYIHEHKSTPIRVTELCAISGKSERTLQYLFKNEIGMTPKAYLSGQRLYGVHRELWQSKPEAVSVSDIANRWGFWHMGQFARDYRKLFDELPSETLNRSS